MDRDDNSAVNILMRFLARRGPHARLAEYGVLQEDQLSGEVMETSPAGGLPPAWDLRCEIQVQQ